MQEFLAYLIRLHRHPIYRLSIYRNAIISAIDIVVNTRNEKRIVRAVSLTILYDLSLRVLSGNCPDEPV